MACGQCIYKWDFSKYKYVHLYSDCDFWCHCDKPPSRYSGEYVYVSCIVSITTTTGDPSTSTTSTSSTTFDPSTSSSSSSSSTTTTEQPYSGMDCLPERIHGVSVDGTGEFHVPLSDSESCVRFPPDKVACGPNSEVLVGNIYNCPTILDPAVELSINVGDYVLKDPTVNYPYGKYRTLALPHPYDFVVISGAVSYVSSSMDFRDVPLRYVYVGPGAVLRNLAFLVNFNDVKEYRKLYKIPYSPGDNIYRLVPNFFTPPYSFSRSADFIPTFQSFTQANPAITYWRTPHDRELQLVTDLPNPRYYCSPNQKTFGIHYSISGGRASLGGDSTESLTYACNIGGLFVAGQNHTCDSDTPNMGHEITVVSNGVHNEIGGFLSYHSYYSDGGYKCCPPVTVGGATFCPKVCPDNSVGPTNIGNVDWKDFYRDPLRQLPYEFTQPLDAISCIPSDYCRDTSFGRPPSYISGCYDDVNDLLVKPVRIRVVGKYVDIPYVYSFGGCNYFVTILKNPSKEYCNREKSNGDRTYLGVWFPSNVSYSPLYGHV